MTAVSRMFAPIGLDELVARAPLLTRVDRKYLVPAEDLPALLGGLPAGVCELDIAGRRRFSYRSAYFDSDGMDSYLTTARRRRHRFKLRVRSYLDTGSHYLEIKTRGPRGTTIKQRFPYEQSTAFLSPGTQQLAVQALTAARVAADGLAFHLALTTEYERTTLFLPSSGSRVTIDRDLMWSLPGGDRLRLPERVIVETKSVRGASPADRVLWALGHRPCPLSKYATGLAALRPDLPSNRWQHVLHRHFAVSSSPAASTLKG